MGESLVYSHQYPLPTLEAVAADLPPAPPESYESKAPSLEERSRILEQCISFDKSESSRDGPLNCMLEQLLEERTEEGAFASPGGSGIDKDS